MAVLSSAERFFFFRCVSVMGPSGAGKSTILDIIARRTPPSAGTVSSVVGGGSFSSHAAVSLLPAFYPQITVNGEEGVDMSALASYVEQDDALLGVLTVQETIRFAARLR